METSLKTDFAQIFSHCPKNLSCPKFGGAAAPLAPPARTPMYTITYPLKCLRPVIFILLLFFLTCFLISEMNNFFVMI